MQVTDEAVKVIHKLLSTHETTYTCISRQGEPRRWQAYCRCGWRGREYPWRRFGSDGSYRAGSDCEKHLDKVASLALDAVAPEIVRANKREIIETWIDGLTERQYIEAFMAGPENFHAALKELVSDGT